MKNKKIIFFFMLITAVILLASCADMIDVKNCCTSEPYGFFGGLWHGFIAWFDFIGSLFSDKIAMYAPNNNGHWYDFGFVIGSGILGGGIWRARK